MKTGISIFAFFFSFFLYGQSEKKIPNPSDTLRIAALFERGWKNQDPVFSDSLATIVKREAVRNNYRHGIGLGYLLEGRSASYIGEFDRAKKSLDKAYSVFIRSGDHEKFATVLAIYGTLGLRIGDLEMAGSKSFELIRFCEIHPVPKRLALAHETVATVCQRQGNFSKAISHAKQALEINRKLDKPMAVAGVGHLPGLLYFQHGRDADAEEWFYDSMKNYRKSGDSVGVAVDYSHIGLIEKKTDYKKAIQTLEKAQLTLEESSFHHNSMYNIGSLARVYLDIFESDSLQAATGILKKTALEKADAHARKALRLSKELGDVQNEMESLNIFSRICHFRGDHEAAYAAMASYMKLYDSLYSQENKNKIAELESAQAMALKDKEIQISKLEIQSRDRQKWLFIGGIVFLVVLVAFVFWQNKNRQRTNKKLRQLNAELEAANAIKTRFFGILNHDLRSPAASVVNYLQLVENEDGIPAEDRAKYRTKIQDSAEFLLETMEDLLLWSKAQMQQFEPQFSDVFLSDILTTMHRLFPQMTFDDPGKLTIFTDEDYLKTILRNLTANATKNTDASRVPVIHWTASEANGQVLLQLTDNGKGADPNSFKALFDETVVSSTRTGLGLHLVRDLT